MTSDPPDPNYLKDQMHKVMVLAHIREHQTSVRSSCNSIPKSLPSESPENTSGQEKWPAYALPEEKSLPAQLEAQGGKGQKLKFLGVEKNLEPRRRHRIAPEWLVQPTINEMCECLRVQSRIEREAIDLLASRTHGFMQSSLLRQRLIKQLVGVETIHLPGINAAIESLVDRRLLLRRVKRGCHEIGLNRAIWKLSPEAIRTVRAATRDAVASQLLDFTLQDLVHDVRHLVRTRYGSNMVVSSNVYQVLVPLFCARQERQ